MDIHLTRDQHDRGAVRLFVDGALVAEHSAGSTQGATSFVAEIAAAHALRSLAAIVQQWGSRLIPQPGHATETRASRAEFGQGLEAGLQNAVVPHPYPGVPPTPPAHTPFYRAGWEHGQALRRCLAVIEAAQKEGVCQSK